MVFIHLALYHLISIYLPVFEQVWFVCLFVCFFRSELASCCNAVHNFIASQNNTPLGSNMSYEVDSKKTILITEDIFRMLPVVRTVSLPVIVITVSYILWNSNRAALFLWKSPFTLYAFPHSLCVTSFLAFLCQWYRHEQHLIDLIVGRVTAEPKLLPVVAVS